MTTYAAYDAGLPCRNTSCKSHGLPHPNCKCYGGLPETRGSATDMVYKGAGSPITGSGMSGSLKAGALVAGVGLAAAAGALGAAASGFMRRKKQDTNVFGSQPYMQAPEDEFAKGGEVKGKVVDHYCQTCMPHDPDCEYFVDGGEVTAPTEIDPSQLEENPLATTPSKTEQKQEEIDPSQLEKAPMSPLAQQISESYPQFVGSKFEASAHGLLGGPATQAVEYGLEKAGVPHMTLAEQAARREAFPGVYKYYEPFGTAVGLATGIGEESMLGRMVPDLPGFGKAGTELVRSFVQGAGKEYGDQWTNYFLTDKDHEFPTAGALLSSLQSGAEWGAAGLISKGLSALKDLAPGTKINSFFSGAGAMAKYHETPERIADFENLIDSYEKKVGKPLFDWDFYDKGKKFAQGLVSKTPLKTALTLGATTGAATAASGGIPAGVQAGLVTALGTLGAQTGGKLAGKKAIPYLLHYAESGLGKGIGKALDYTSKSIGGMQTLNDSVTSLLKGYGTSQMSEDQLAEAREKLRRQVEEDKFDQGIQEQIYENNLENVPGYAEGGLVEKPNPVSENPANIIPEDNPVAKAYPVQNMMFNAARARVANYLKELKPQQFMQKLPFDEIPDQSESKRTFDKALDVANHPLSVLEKAEKGQLTPEYLHHFRSMYPEIHNSVQKQLTSQITEMQLKNEKPNFKARQGISMILGAPVSSDLKPQNIMAAQSVFAGNTPAPQQAQPKKSSKASLSKSEQSYLTQGQALVTRQQHQKS